MNRQPIILDDVNKRTMRAATYNKRLRIIMIVFALIGLIVASLYFNAIDRRENHAADSRMETFTELRQSTLSRYLNSRAQETILWAGHDSVTSEAARYFEIWNGLSGQERAALRGHYVGGLAPDDTSGLDEAYRAHHGRYHENRAAFMHHHGYYDVFYFNLKGDLVYSAEKEADYGLNFSAGGGHAETNLGRAFQVARDGEAGTTVFFDFAPYAPSGGTPASFLAAPMVNARGDTIGVYAIQLSIEKFNTVLQYASGLGETGETYVVGEDLLMRNNSRLSDTPTMLERTVDTPAVRAALSGREMLTRKSRNAAGNKVLLAARPLEFGGTTWAVVTEMELAELKQPLRPYRWFYFVSLLFILAFAAMQYWLLRIRAD